MTSDQLLYSDPLKAAEQAQQLQAEKEAQAKLEAAARKEIISVELQGRPEGMKDFKIGEHGILFDPKELADISLVCDAMAIHYGIDLQKEKELKMFVNEKRK